MSKVIRYFGIITCIFCFMGIARADVLIPVDGKVFQNNNQNPCIIYGNGNCYDPAGWDEMGKTQGNFDITSESGPNSEVDDYVITVGELRSALGFDSASTVEFLLGLDLNQTSDPQANLIIEVFAGNTMYYQFGQEEISTENQGTGWADYVGAKAYDINTGLFTPIQIGANISDATIVQFRLALDANDGPDQLFLIRFGGNDPDPDPTQNPVPEPASLVLLGTGLGLIGVIARRRLK